MAARGRGLAAQKGTKAGQNGTKPEKVPSQSSDSDSDQWNYDLKSRMSRKWKPPRHSLEDLDLTPQDFEDCDLDILDGLDIKGWEKFKAQLEGWTLGDRQTRSSPPRSEVCHKDSAKGWRWSGSSPVARCRFPVTSLWQFREWHKHWPRNSIVTIWLGYGGRIWSINCCGRSLDHAQPLKRTKLAVLHGPGRQLMARLISQSGEGISITGK